MRARVRASLLFAALACGAGARGASPPSVELAVKATYVVKFASYIGWPADALADPAAPLFLCVVGGPPFGGLLDSAAQGQMAGQHPILVRQMASIDRSAGCQIAAFGGGRAATVQGLAAVRGAPIVTITDARLTDTRGMIHFEVVGGRVRFHVDQALAAEDHLNISSKLLALALSVKKR